MVKGGEKKDWSVPERRRQGRLVSGIEEETWTTGQCQRGEREDWSVPEKREGRLVSAREEEIGKTSQCQRGGDREDCSVPLYEDQTWPDRYNLRDRTVERQNS